MKDIHDLLGETLRDERWALPVGAGVLDAIESGARRVRRRRRRSAALAAAVAVVIAGSVAVAARDPRLDGAPRPASSTIPLPEGPGRSNALALTQTSLYVMTRTRVHRIDRATQRLVASSPRLPVERPERLQVVGDTLWAEAWVRSDGQTSDVRYYALDATTLARRSGSSLTEKERHVAGSDALFSFQHDSSRESLVRRDPGTGKVIRRSPVRATCNPPYVSYAIAADEAARVVWLACHPDDDSVSLLALDSETGAERGRVQLGKGIQYSALGSDGTLWVMVVPLPSDFMWQPRKPARYFHLTPDGGRTLPVGSFREIDRLRPSFGLRLVAAGSRLLHQTQGEHEVGCIDRRTGRLLATYPVPMRREEDTSALAGDDREIFTTTGNQIIVRRGPDKCLS